MTDFFCKDYFTKQKIKTYFNYLFTIYIFVLTIDASKIDGILAILVLFFIINFEYKKISTIVKENRLLQAILMLSFLILISYLWSTDNSQLRSHKHYSDIFYYYYRYTLFFLLPIIMIVTNLKKEFIPVVINSFIFAMFANEIVSYGVFFGLWSPPYGYGSVSDPLPFISNHMIYSTLLGFTILLSLYKFSHIKNIYMRIIYFIFTTTMSINLFLSSGRTGQFSLFVTIFVISVIYFRKKIKLMLISLSTLVIIFVVAFFTITTFHHRVIQAKNDVMHIINHKKMDTSFGTRIMAFDTIPYLVNKDNIIFGVGIGDKPYYVSSTLKKEYPYRLYNFDKFGYLHNSHIEILISNGLVGLLLYLAIFYFTFTIKIKDNFIKYISYALPIYYFCYGLTGDIFGFKEIMLLFGLFLGLIILQYHLETNQLESKEKEII